MTVFRLTKERIEKLPEPTFGQLGVLERGDLQRVLRANISAIAPDVLVIAEEFCEWEDSKRRIDLLGVDRNANLVVIELKRDNEGGHMDLQAVRYAAMVSSMSFERAVDVYQCFLDESPQSADARLRLLDFLGWEEPHEEDFARETRIILVAADFLKELTTTVLWLNDCGLDIRCVRMKPYKLGSEVLVDVQQIVPLPEAEEYQVRMREKTISRRDALRRKVEPTGYWFMNTGDGSNEGRAWEDCKKYGFMLAGGGERYISLVQKLRVGDKVFAYLSGSGYVGLGEVIAEAVPQKDFVPPNHTKRLVDLPLVAQLEQDRLHDVARCDWCVAVKWLAAVEREQGVHRSRAFRNTLCQIHQRDLVDDLLRSFGLDECDVKS